VRVRAKLVVEGELQALDLRLLLGQSVLEEALDGDEHLRFLMLPAEHRAKGAHGQHRGEHVAPNLLATHRVKEVTQFRFLRVHFFQIVLFFF
jgi:hypothetical protein